MKSMIAALAVAVLLFSPGLATADDKDDVIACDKANQSSGIAQTVGPRLASQVINGTWRMYAG